MEDVAIIGVIASIIIGIVQLIFAFVFAGIAERKGYSKGNSLIICILFGVIGFIYVSALPDMNVIERIKRLEDNLIDGKTDTLRSEKDVISAKAYEDFLDNHEFKTLDL